MIIDICGGDYVIILFKLTSVNCHLFFREHTLEKDITLTGGQNGNKIEEAGYATIY
jgi:hypothetical protein